MMFRDFTLLFGIWILFLCGCLASAQDALLFPKFEVSSTIFLEFLSRSRLMKLSCDFIVQNESLHFVCNGLLMAKAYIIFYTLHRPNLSSHFKLCSLSSLPFHIFSLLLWYKKRSKKLWEGCAALCLVLLWISERGKLWYCLSFFALCNLLQFG